MFCLLSESVRSPVKDGLKLKKPAGRRTYVSPPVGFYSCYTLPLGFSLSLLLLFLFPVLHAADPVGQTHKALGKMYILNYDIIRYI